MTIDFSAYEAAAARVREAVDQRRRDGYPDSFPIPELFGVTLGDLNTILANPQLQQEWGVQAEHSVSAFPVRDESLAERLAADYSRLREPGCLPTPHHVVTRMATRWRRRDEADQLPAQDEQTQTVRRALNDREIDRALAVLLLREGGRAIFTPQELLEAPEHGEFACWPHLSTGGMVLAVQARTPEEQPAASNESGCPCGCPVVDDMCSCPDPCPCEPDCAFCLVPNPMRTPGAES